MSNLLNFDIHFLFAGLQTTPSRFKFEELSFLSLKFIFIINDAQKSSMSCWIQITLVGTCRTRTQESNRRHWCGTGQRPSKSQVSE